MFFFIKKENIYKYMKIVLSSGVRFGGTNSSEHTLLIDISTPGANHLLAKLSSWITGERPLEYGAICLERPVPAPWGY